MALDLAADARKVTDNLSHFIILSFYIQLPIPTTTQRRYLVPHSVQKLQSLFYQLSDLGFAPNKIVNPSRQKEYDKKMKS